MSLKKIIPTNRRLREIILLTLAVGLLLSLVALISPSSEDEKPSEEKAAKAIATPPKPKPTPPPPPHPCRPKKEKCVYLTFDDGPFPLTPKFTTYLKKHRLNATFFVLASNLNSYKKYIKHYDYEGFTLANHSDVHRYLPSLSDKALRKDLSYTNKKIRGITGKKVKCYRPPYGATNSRVRRIAKDLGLREILWDVDPQDWARPGRDAIVARVMAQVKPGAIILFHDGGGDRSQTLAALPIVVKKLKAKGYGFASLCD